MEYNIKGCASARVNYLKPEYLFPGQHFQRLFNQRCFSKHFSCQTSFVFYCHAPPCINAHVPQASLLYSPYTSFHSYPSRSLFHSVICNNSIELFNSEYEALYYTSDFFLSCQKGLKANTNGVLPRCCAVSQYRYTEEGTSILLSI